jgi:RNA polymerase sigma factor (sigma-70 family)
MRRHPGDIDAPRFEERIIRETMYNPRKRSRRPSRVPSGYSGQMGDMLLTRASLLARLRDPRDGAAWRQFVELYGGLVYGFARRRGLQNADAADLTQDVFLAVAQGADRFHYIARLLRERHSQPVGAGDSETQHRLAEEPDPCSDLDADWEQEFQRQLFCLAADQLQKSFAPTTWKAFWQTAVEGRSGAAVAAELSLSVGAVYVARSRVLARLTEQIRQMQAE